MSDLLMCNRRYFRYSKEPFALTLAGETIYVITSPQDAAEIYKNTSTLSLHSFVKTMYIWIGVSAASIEMMWAAPSPHKKATNARARPAHEMLEEFHRQQLQQSGEHSSVLTKRLQERIDLSLQFESLQKHAAVVDRGPGFLNVSLWHLCTHLFIEGLTEAYLGQLIWKIRPEILQSSLRWEDTSWKYIYHLPRFVSHDMYTARSEIIGSFTEYFKSPKVDRADSLFFVDAFEQELRDCNLNEEEIAGAFMLHHWA